MACEWPGFMGVLPDGDVTVRLEEEPFLGINEDEGGAGFGGAVMNLRSMM